MKIMYLVNILYALLVMSQETGLIEVLPFNDSFKAFVKSSALTLIGIYDMIILRQRFFPKPPKNFPKQKTDIHF